MFKIFTIMYFFVSVNSLPVNSKENEELSTIKDESESSVGEPRAGVLDILNPTQILPGNQGSNPGTNNNDNNNNNPLSGIQNMFSNLNFLNGTNGNPLQSLFSGNALNGAKVFLISTQGLVMPVDTILKGFTSLFQGLPSMPGLSNLPLPQIG